MLVPFPCTFKYSVVYETLPIYIIPDKHVYRYHNNTPEERNIIKEEKEENILIKFFTSPLP